MFKQIGHKRKWRQVCGVFGGAEATSLAAPIAQVASIYREMLGAKRRSKSGQKPTAFLVLGVFCFQGDNTGARSHADLKFKPKVDAFLFLRYVWSTLPGILESQRGPLPLTSGPGLGVGSLGQGGSTVLFEMGCLHRPSTNSPHSSRWINPFLAFSTGSATPSQEGNIPVRHYALLRMK